MLEGVEIDDVGGEVGLTRCAWVHRAEVVEIKRLDDMLALVADHGQLLLAAHLALSLIQTDKESSLSNLQAAVGS